MATRGEKKELEPLEEGLKKRKGDPVAIAISIWKIQRHRYSTTAGAHFLERSYQPRAYRLGSFLYICLNIYMDQSRTHITTFAFNFGMAGVHQVLEEGYTPGS